jgi:predicted short-subunit dehydrogenase-like oxidoreductase (DUF2520 family)
VDWSACVATTLPSPFSFLLIGAGRVGTAVAEFLRRGGHSPIGVASRTADGRARAAQLLDAPEVELTDLPRADVILLGVPDDAVGPLATQLSTSVGAGQAVVHFAGALGIDALAPVIRAGAWGCALHPVQACPDIDTALARLPGSAWGVTCTWPATEWAHDLVRGPLGGTPVDVAEDARPLWHAAAVSTSNGIAALMAIGENLLGMIGIDRPHEVLGPLARGTVENALAGGGGARTLTGPVVRGEVETVRRHLAALDASAPSARLAYELASRVVLEAAVAAGRLDGSTARSLRDVLEGS